MKQLFLSLATMLCALCAQAQERAFLSLSGTWESSLGTCRLPGTTDENQLGNPAQAPYVTSQLTRLHSYSGQVIYERDFTLPEGFAGKKLRLIMERTKPSTLWIDGDSIGSLTHLYAPHCYELPLLKAGKHHIAIRIDNSETSVPREIQTSHAWTDATQTNWNGILGRLGIEARDEAYIEKVEVYPSLARKRAFVKLTVCTERYEDAMLRIEGEAWNTPMSHKLPPVEQKIPLQAGVTSFTLSLDMGESPLVWSEFHPALYRLHVRLDTDHTHDEQCVDFGMREFRTEGNRFVLNGKKIFLRGKHDACVFPLTGYAPMDVEAWRGVLRTAKRYGINHYRCHSYTPPEAALKAADMEGVYFQVELPLWGAIERKNTALNAFLKREGDMILSWLGNHPSLMMLGLGNELHGEVEVMREWLDDFRKKDPRHLYCFGSNNNLGWKGPQDGEDYFVTCRVGGGEGYSTHVRTSFAYVDAEKGGILNNTRPNTIADYAQAIARCPRPVVGHETCQFQIYPDYSQIAKYKGVLYPYNLEIFRNRLKENQLYGQADDFHRATGRFSVECYKADIEYALRTPGFGGFQMLDLQDYPGQGSALVGILDAFMETKGIVDPETFYGFCAPVVPLARMESFCWWNTQKMKIDVALSNYEEDDWEKTVYWQLVSDDGLWEKQGMFSCFVPQGEVGEVGHIELSLSDLDVPQRLTLHLKTGTYHNYYHLWVYPNGRESAAGIHVDSLLNERVKAELEKGGTVFLVPRHKDIEKQSVGGMFTPDYWNYAMFKTISERAGKEISPGTMSVMVDPAHPLFHYFPTEAHSDWQWWSIARYARPMVLDKTTKSYRPVVQVIDNVERNHKLGIVFEFRVGKGKLLVCTANLAFIENTPEGNGFRTALLRYVKSEQFQPETSVTWKELTAFFTESVVQRNIKGVKNQSDYNVNAQM